MNQTIYDNYLDILRSELIPALGCTEPIAISYAAAKAAELLGCRPEKIETWCSGNIIKNVQGVTVPYSGGLKGVEAAAILGALGGDSSKNLEVLEGMEPEIALEAKALMGSGYCDSHLVEGVSNLYILARVFGDHHFVEVEIADKHTNIVKITRDGQILYEKVPGENCDSCAIGDMNLLNVKDILAFAKVVDLTEIQDVLERQIQMNTAIAEEGLTGKYGVAVGKTLLDVYGNDIKIRAKAKAAAGSDARMSGCTFPVGINSGSGNQGMTVSLPVIEYAEELHVSQNHLYRALIVSNLVALHQKKYIGNLSAYCGAVSAACGSGAGITYLHGGDYNDISRTIVNTIANVGGIVCDGAKPSCAAKIASAVDAAIMGHHMSARQQAFASGEGLVQGDVERTIQNIGRMGCVGMKSTDLEILNIMLEKESKSE